MHYTQLICHHTHNDREGSQTVRLPEWQYIIEMETILEASAHGYVIFVDRRRHYRVTRDVTDMC